jgi:cyclophilin family peptidyl-prolyl cis-trans isomerase
LGPVAILAQAAPASRPIALSEGDIGVYARLLAMTDARQFNDTVIRAALASRATSLRAAGALAIGQVRARVHAPVLVGLLTDADTVVAANAAYALGLLRDTASAGALTAALAGPITVAVDAAWALGELGGPRAARLIDSLLTGEPLRAPVMQSLLLSATKLRPIPVATISRHLGSADPGTAAKAAYALTRSSNPSAIRGLVQRVLSRDPEMLSYIARGLGKTVAGDSLSELARGTLGLLVESRDPHVRINAVRALATYGDSSRLAVIAAARDPNPMVRLVAAQSLGLVMDRDIARWAWLWDSDTSLTYRKAVLNGAIRAGIDLPAMRAWRTSPDWNERAALASAAAASPSAARTMQIALPLIHDVDPRVRSAALTVISARADSVPGMADTVRLALTDRDAGVRAVAINSIARRARAVDVPRLAGAYRRALADSANDARVAAISAISAVWRRDSASFTDSLRTVVAGLPQPPDPAVTTAARGASVFSTWTVTPPRAPRTTAWYEEVVRRLLVPAQAGKRPVVNIVTDRGTIVVELFADETPLTVNSFLSLASSGYYAGTRFHRVIGNFMAQGGNSRDGRGPGYTIRDELTRHRHERGMLSMAHAGPDTGGSQFFITHSPQPHLDGLHTVFGRVLSGHTVLDAIVEGDGLIQVRIP